MNLLLDSHTFIWWHEEPQKLSTNAFEAISEPANSIFLSLVSIWEIQLKLLTGKLTLNEKLGDAVQNERDRNGFGLLSVELEHIIGLANLPNYHKDPFDRLMIAQSITEKMTLVTVDSMLSAYDVATLW